MNIMRRFTFVVLILPLAAVRVLILFLGSIPYWIVTGENLFTYYIKKDHAFDKFYEWGTK